jgi:hypothetical protein
MSNVRSSMLGMFNGVGAKPQSPAADSTATPSAPIVRDARAMAKALRPVPPPDVLPPLEIQLIDPGAQYTNVSSAPSLLERLVLNPDAFDEFHDFLRLEFAAESLDFWIACREFRQTDPDTLNDCPAERSIATEMQIHNAEAIYGRFLSKSVRKVPRDSLTNSVYACFFSDPLIKY